MTVPPPTAERSPSGRSPSAFAAALERIAALAERADSPEAALEAGVELTCELTGWPLGHVVLPEPGGNGGPAVLCDTNIWHLAPRRSAADGAAADGAGAGGGSLAGALATAEAGPLPGGVGPGAPTAAGRAFAAGRPVWLAANATDAGGPSGDAAGGAVRGALAERGSRGAFAVPILVRGRVAAVCEFFAPEPPPEGREEDQEEEETGALGGPGAIAAAVGRQIAAALTAARTRATLAAREDDLDDLFETAAAGIVLLEPDGTIRRANRAFAQMLGRAPGTLAGRAIAASFAPGGRGGGPLLAAARSGRPLLGHEADFLTAGVGADGGGAVRTLLIDADARSAPAPPGPGEAPNRPASGAAPAAGPGGPAPGPSASGPSASGLFVGPVLRCFARDVTARRRRDQDRNRLAEIVRAIPDAVSSKDLSGTIRTWNEGAVRMYGHAADRALGLTATELGIVPRERIEEDRRLLATAVEGRRVEQFQTKRVRADGTRIDVSLTVGPVRDAAGRVVGAAFMARDVTEQKRAAEELERATSRAEQASRAKSEFLANVSHELRTPMSAILGFTELAADEPLPPHVLDWLGTVQESADHLLALLNEILDFSRIESRRFELEPVPFSPREVVEETVRSLAPQADRKGLELTGSVGPGVPPAALGDPVRLRQILTNLVGNAVKFTDRGRVAVRIERRPADGEAPADGAAPGDEPPAVGVPVGLHLTVSDTGPGIAAADRERVFQPFAQADNTVTRKHGGTGLGLSITHRLVNLMGGAIWMESVSGAEVGSGKWGGGRRKGEGGRRNEAVPEAGRAADDRLRVPSPLPPPPSPIPETGTTFHVTLTLPAADAGAVSAEGTLADVPEEAAPRLRGLPVLVVDASPENRRLLCEALESWQMAPVAAATAEEAHDLVAAAAAKGRAFPLVLADAALAGLSPGSDAGDAPGAGADGGEIRLVSEAAAAGGKGVVLVTADGRRRRRAELDAPGVAGTVEKPIARSELLDTIVAALGAEPVHDGGEGRPRSVTPAAAAGRLRVLLVEDTAANRKVITAVLTKRGHKVATAVNGRAGVDEFVRSLDKIAGGAARGKRPRGFDAVLMDVQMPVLDGLQAVAELRRIEAARGLPRTPVLALTAHALKGDRERCLAAGMDGYLSKPLDVHELIGTLERHARRARRAPGSRSPSQNPPGVAAGGPVGGSSGGSLGNSEGDSSVPSESDSLAASDPPSDPPPEEEEEGPAVFDRSAALARMGGGQRAAGGDRRAVRRGRPAAVPRLRPGRRRRERGSGAGGGPHAQGDLRHAGGGTGESRRRRRGGRRRRPRRPGPDGRPGRLRVRPRRSRRPPPRRRRPRRRRPATRRRPHRGVSDPVRRIARAATVRERDTPPIVGAPLRSLTVAALAPSNREVSAGSGPRFFPRSANLSSRRPDVGPP